VTATGFDFSAYVFAGLLPIVALPILITKFRLATTLLLRTRRTALSPVSMMMLIPGA